MDPLRPSDLGALAGGVRTLLRRPGTTFGMLVAGVLLSAVGPLLHRATGRGDELSYLLLGVAGMLPWELYFLPWFLARADAESLGHPANPAEGWRERFEARWLRTLGAKVALNLALALGGLALVVPGLVVLFAFGWVPHRVLLRGETLPEAMRGSLAMMRRGWRRAVLMVGGAFSLALLAMAGLLAAAAAVHPGQGPLPFTSPMRWALEACSVAVSLWLSATLLVAFQRLEGDQSPGSK